MLHLQYMRILGFENATKIEAESFNVGPDASYTRYGHVNEKRQTRVTLPWLFKMNFN